MKYLVTSSFVVTLLVCLSVKHASCIKCYDCANTALNATDDPQCKQCSGSVCSIVIKTKENGEGFITRSCGSNTNGTLIGGQVKSGEDHGQYTAGGAHVFWSTCTTDFCNWDVTHGHRIRRQIDKLFGGFNIHSPSVADGNKPGVNTIQCYNCITNPLDEDDTTCKENNMTALPCNGACAVIKVAFAGDYIIARLCDIEEFIQSVPWKMNRDHDSITRFGITISWRQCTTNLCNWGVMNKYQMMTLFVSAMLSLSVYCTMF